VHDDESYDVLVRKALHLMFGGLTRSLIAFGAFALLIGAGPFIAAWFDDRGIPGAAIVLLVLATGACASGFAFFFTMTPRRRRSRALRKLAGDLRLPYREKVWLSRDVRTLPSFQLLAGWVAHDGIEGHRDSGPLFVFARSWSPDEYEPTRVGSVRGNNDHPLRAAALDRSPTPLRR
jgi:hypothetical protein